MPTINKYHNQIRENNTKYKIQGHLLLLYRFIH